MHRIRVESVEEAVKAAKELMGSNRTFWFRGQAKDWPLRSSLVRARMEQDNDLPIMEKLARYAAWVKHTPGLENIAADVDATIAVAQHYGIPTNFVDFTTNPEVAGFFASEKANFETSKDLACIICIDVENFKEFWKLLPKQYTQPEFLEMSVPDLWRLEAQCGCFLYCPYENIEHLYDFDRIYFPNTHPLRGIKHQDIYPKRKSHLEILLDQFFMNESMLDAQKIPPPGNAIQLVFESPPEGYEPEIFPNGLPEHPSWSNDILQPWLKIPAESLNNAQTAVNFQIRIPDIQDTNMIDVTKDISEQLISDLFGLAGIRSKLIGWHLELRGNNGLPQNFESLLTPKLERLWDGLRSLPYSDIDLSYGIGHCISLAIALAGDFCNVNHIHWEQAAQKCLQKPIELEFGAGDGSYSRGYASTKNLANAIRSDIQSYIAEKWKEQFNTNVRHILQTAWTPQKTFHFKHLTPIFAREIAPYQVLARKTAVFYSPARLLSFGLP